MILDNKLNWTEQISNVMEKVKKSSSILKRLACKKWGSTMEVLNNTFYTHIKPILQYRGEVMLTTSHRKIN